MGQDFEQGTSQNGIKVYSEYDPAVHSVTLGLWFRVGSRDEQVSEGGLSHFMEHMMFKGTKTRTYLDISSAFDAMGAELNAFTSKEYTCYFARMQDSDLERSFELLSDMVQHSQFPQAEIEKEREVVIEEIARGEDEPSDYIFDMFSQALYPSNPLGRSIAGKREVVGGFMHENCLDYLHKHYHKGNLSVVAAGNIKQPRLLELVDKYLVDLPEGQPNQRPAVSGQVALPQSFLQKETEQAHIVYGVPGFGLDDPRRYASRLLETVLAGPMSSRLFQEIREKRGLAYAVFATTMSFIGGGQLAIYCGTRPDNIGQVVSVLHTELNRLLADGISDEEFDRAREYTLGHLILNSESTQSKMTRLGGQAVGGLEVHSLDWTLDRYRSLRKDDLMKVAQELFTQTPTVCIISPLSLEQMSKTVQQALTA